MTIAICGLKSKDAPSLSGGTSRWKLPKSEEGTEDATTLCGGDSRLLLSSQRLQGAQLQQQAGASTGQAGGILRR